MKDIKCYLKLGNKLSPSIKARLFSEGILNNVCSICGLKDIWNGKPLQLQIDHIDGNPKNNRKNNLRVICPNCHSQTKNFAGKNKGNVIEVPLNEIKSFSVKNKKTGEWIDLPLVSSLYFTKGSN